MIGPTNIYLDNAATTPVDPEVLVAMMPFFADAFGNPSSVHSHGQRAHAALDTAREQVAALIHAQPEEIVFTSGGTEACNLALFGHCVAQPIGKAHLAISAMEHDAVLKTAAQLDARGFAKVSTLGIDRFAVIDLADLQRCLTDGITLLSVMTANNDVGTVQPIAALADLAWSAGALFHTDAVQAIGKVAMDVNDIGVDMVSFSAHKIGGPKGVGALYVRRGTRLAPSIFGGAQESRRRAGTENLPGIVGFGRACELSATRLTEDIRRIADMRSTLESRVAQIPSAVIHGAGADRLPGILCVSFPGIPGETLVMSMDLAGFSISNGSACHSDSRDPSHTLTAMKVPPEAARSMIRVSIGRQNTDAEILQVADALEKIVCKLIQRK